MEPTSILLITITVLLAILTIGVWGILFALVKSQSGMNAERSAAVSAISEECAEADRVLSSSSAKALSAHGLRSALAPRTEKVRKLLTAHMHLLDPFFVKYTETRLAAFQAACSSPDQAAVFPIDKYLSDTKAAEVSVDDLKEKLEKELPSQAILHDLRSRIEAPGAPSPDSTRDTVLVKGEKSEEPVVWPPVEPAGIDLRTGIITVEQEGTGQAPGKEKTPDRGRSVPGAIHTDKTMRWDKEELRGLADRPESIVVEGGEVAKAKSQPQGRKKPDAASPVPPPGADAKREEAMISGDDIESTLDSFFGLGDK